MDHDNNSQNQTSHFPPVASSDYDGAQNAKQQNTTDFSSTPDGQKTELQQGQTESVQDQRNYNIPYRRITAFVIDVFLFSLPVNLIVHYIGTENVNSWVIMNRLQNILLTLLLLCLYVGYFTFMEMKFGYTIGKLFFNIRVTMEDGSSLTLKASLIRNSYRLLWAFFSPSVLPDVYLIFKGKKKQRVGDLSAKTIVTKKARGF